jgi:hypothetical protein
MRSQARTTPWVEISMERNGHNNNNFKNCANQSRCTPPENINTTEIMDSGCTVKYIMVSAHCKNPTCGESYACEASK